MKKLLAFTLAETLIVMGIIGVVAALTVPNLNSSTAEKEKIAKVKKVYAQLNEAMARATAVYGPFGEWFSLDEEDPVVIERVGDRLTEFMKLSKNCGMSTDQGCFNNGKEINIGNPDTSDHAYKFILADGTSVALGPLAISFDYIVKIDGPKSKPLYGKNIFVFTQDTNFDGEPIAFLDDILPTEKVANKNDDAAAVEMCLKKEAGGERLACASWVLDYDNMDYLKADENGKCPNGKILDGTTNTSCK